jgi:hypothetical protein
MVWELPEAESVIVTKPLRVPVPVGTKVTVMGQDAFTDKLAPHPVLIWKSPFTVTLLMVTSEPPYLEAVLFTVTDCDALLEFRVWTGKVRAPLENVSPEASTPVPLKVTV